MVKLITGFYRISVGVRSSADQFSCVRESWILYPYGTRISNLIEYNIALQERICIGVAVAKVYRTSYPLVFYWHAKATTR